MANVLVQESSLQAIANAIRSKNGLQDTYTPAQMAPAVLAFPASAPGLGTKAITANGVFYAVDDGLDGYSSITVSRDPALHTWAFDISNGYVSSGNYWGTRYSGYFSDVYKVISGHRYRICLGSNPGNLFNAMYSSEDPSQAEEKGAGVLMVAGTTVVNTSGSANAQVDEWTAPDDGYLTITKTGSNYSNKKTFVFDITLTEDLS